MGPTLRKELWQPPFIGRPGNQGHTGYLGNFIGAQLRITTHHGHLGMGGVAQSLSNHFGTFAVSLIGHRTGIDDVNVGALFKGNRLVTLVLKGFTNRQSVGVIQLATQGVNSHPRRFRLGRQC